MSQLHSYYPGDWKEVRHWTHDPVTLTPEKGNPYPINPLNAELNPICHLLALLGVHHILHVSRIRVNLTL